ncbi:IQUB [Symbiodinium natans]|uniref:IQUB protein n=1 Tax=Symbiodinium natans TaxID=878477 RepID=A0A812URU4_9DINO|nr:IQUB [Symbiodinium natans]
MPDMLDLKVMNEHGEVRFAAVECEGEGAKGRRGAQQSLRKCCGAEMSRPRIPKYQGSSFCTVISRFVRSKSRRVGGVEESRSGGVQYWTSCDNRDGHVRPSKNLRWWLEFPGRTRIPAHSSQHVTTDVRVPFHFPSSQPKHCAVFACFCQSRQERMVTVHVQRPVMEKPEAKELKPRDCPCFLDCPQVVLKVGLTSGISFCWCHKSCGRSRPYLGGFRNKVTDSMSEAKMGVTGMLHGLDFSGEVSQYHHAVTQTAPVQKKDVHTLRFHREAQTYEYRTRSTQCKRDNGTQMDKVGLYIDSRTDKMMEPRRPYFSSADKAALLLEKCVMIQCHARGMLARRRTRQLRQMRQERQELARKEAERRQLEADLRHKREVERRMHPRTFEDFSVLYKELEAWRVNEAARIQNSGFDEATRRAAQHELLRKETKLLQTIDKLKIQAHTSNRDAKIKSKLESMSQPKVWAQGDGETTTVHTPFTTRAKELMDLYSGLRLPLLTVDERLDVLLHVKWTVKEFDCNLTREMVDLIDREAWLHGNISHSHAVEGVANARTGTYHKIHTPCLVGRGRGQVCWFAASWVLTVVPGTVDDMLLLLEVVAGGLRHRFIETPEFNPEAMKFQKVSREFYDQTGTHPLSTVPIKALGS